METDASLWTAAAALGCFVVVYALERLALSRGWLSYFRIGLPLRPHLVPLPRMPEGDGRTDSVAWRVFQDDALAIFYADPGRTRAPWGLHGAVAFLRRSDGRVAAELRWCPPWTPAFAVAWLAGVGLARGEGTFSVPMAALFVFAVGAVYHQAAGRAARELRWAWVRGDTLDDPESGSDVF